VGFATNGNEPYRTRHFADGAQRFQRIEASGLASDSRSCTPFMSSAKAKIGATS